MKRTINPGAGFTLIELLMVIVVIAILVAILLPVLQSSKNEIKRKKYAMDCKTIAAAIFSYEQDLNQYPIPSGNCRDYTEDNYLVVEVLAHPTNAVKYLDPGNYSKTENGSLKKPDGQPYTLSFPDNRTAKVEGTNVRDY